jgi:serine/threonine protein kinase
MLTAAELRKTKKGYTIPNLGARKRAEQKLKASPEILVRAVLDPKDKAKVASAQLSFITPTTVPASIDSLDYNALTNALGNVSENYRDQFELVPTGNILGSGTFGIVDKIYVGGIPYARKKIKLEQLLKSYSEASQPYIKWKIVQNARTEISKLYTLNPTGLFPQIKDYFVDPMNNSITIIMEALGGSTLHRLSPVMNAANKPYFLTQIINKVAELHKFGYIHGDLKSDNIVIDPIGPKVFLIDAGSVTKIGTPYNPDVPQTYSAYRNAKTGVQPASALYAQMVSLTGNPPTFHPIIDIYALVMVHRYMFIEQTPIRTATQDHWDKFITFLSTNPGINPTFLDTVRGCWRRMNPSASNLFGGYRKSRSKKARKPRQKKVTRRYRRPA